ncbi:MAG: hypothetical protein GYA30_02980 [Chloroflexi bacterium]|nr:hypothetical protein [Chloroflexota bacterium]
MLWKILRELAIGQGVQSLEALARALDITPALAQQMTQELARLGYLSEAAPCASGCEGCALQSACGPASVGPRLWSVTPKGYQALAQRDGSFARSPTEGLPAA